MTPQEELDRAYDTGLRNGKNHSTPSPETREKLAKLETNYTNMAEKIEELKQDNLDGHKEIKDLIEKLSTKIDAVMDKKADKTTVEDLQDDVESLKSWQWKMIGAIIVVVFIVYVLRDYILSALSKI